MADTTATGAPAPEESAIQTDYKIGQDNIRGQIGPFGLDIHNPVFAISGVSVIIFVIVTLLFPDTATGVFGAMMSWVTTRFDWFFILTANIFLVFAIFLAISPYGKVRLGGPDAKPDFTTSGWLAMLFAAGMGIGLLFWSVGEPMTHFASSVAEDAGTPESWAPLGGMPGDVAGSARLGMAATLYHWGLQAWAIYAVVALALALFAFNKGLPLALRSAFYPIFGERVWGWTGHIIDTLAVLATLFGLATSLGLGAEQINAGLNYLYGVPVNSFVKIVLIAVITGVALTSVLRGLDGGVKLASEINMALAFLLLLFVLFVGPTGAALSRVGTSVVDYFAYLPALSMPFGREDENYAQGWSSFYWAWWVSWSPFVGMFIARVSRGRTVREFIVCVMLIPSAVCIIWMSIFAGVAFDQYINDGYTAVADAALEVKLFEMFDVMPLAQLTSLIGIILVAVFFITSSDSGSLVIDTITAGGKDDGPIPQRVFWCIFEGLVAIALLLGGGLGALQSMVVTTGFPFAFVLLLMCVSIVMGLRSEPVVRDRRTPAAT
ncbi:BCCT family betaine/carnitine transporter [Palleronia aestuarii]|uniref:BCCT family betaine/carnitine transporter n=1 Tax=Palleronia aestuarii TaxID=568105 RepID=A0A2W7Q4A5_9RHOB|nr:BCCT family transporter [Palleronia aestuarii]PZX16509.1 BCCT family betaine/carnitine transporter [Palleronia aestuarii]